MFTDFNANQLEVGKVYLFKVNSRKRRIKGKVISKDCYFTGLSIYHGSEAIKIKNMNRRSWNNFTIAVSGIKNAEEVKETTN